MSVLITGGCGFIGAHLTRALAARDDRVVLIDTAPPASPPDLGDRVLAVTGDVTDADLLAETMARHHVVDVIHAAAVVGVAAGARSPANTVHVNVDGAASVLAAAAATGVRRVVDLSSEEVYGDFPTDRATEDTPKDPVSPYGISKLAAEQLGRYYAAHHGLSYAAVRLCWVYGPGFPRRRLPQPWLEDIALGRPSHLERGGDQLLDLTYVADAVAGILAVRDAPTLRHHVYNVATGVATSVRKLAALLLARWPDWQVDVGDGPLELAPGIDAARKGALDITRARDELGYRPRVSLDDGLDRTLWSLAATQEDG